MIDLNLEIIDDSPAGPGRGKAPIRKPIVNQEGQKITFLSSHPEYTINIIQNLMEIKKLQQLELLLVDLLEHGMA